MSVKGDVGSVGGIGKGGGSGVVVAAAAVAAAVLERPGVLRAQVTHYVPLRCIPSFNFILNFTKVYVSLWAHK